MGGAQCADPSYDIAMQDHQVLAHLSWDLDLAQTQFYTNETQNVMVTCTHPRPQH